MTGTEVLTEKLIDTATELEEIITGYRQSVNRFYAIGQEIDSFWEGPASDEFAILIANDKTNFVAMARLMESYVATLRRSASEYVKAENDVLERLNLHKIRRGH